MGREKDVKGKIEAAALRLFVERGVAETSIREIATAAGVSQGAMYNHYPSKEELAWSLFSVNFSELGVELRRLAQEQDRIAGKLRAMVRHVFDRFDEDWVLVSYVFFARHQYLKRVTPALGNPYTVFRSVIAEAIRHGEIPRQDVEMATSLVAGAVIQMIDTRILGRLTGKLGGLSDKVAAALVRLLGGT
jgi:AcrR family transcriptional regulator